MSMLDSALQQALQLHREPGLLFAMQGHALPADMARLLRIVSDEASAQDNAKTLGLSPVELQKLSANYLRGVCLYAGSEPLRCLGLNDAHDLRLAKEHHRLLMKWLHPDRNADQQIFAERVNQAWTQLKTGRFGERMPVAKTWQPAEPLVAPTSHSRFPLFLWLLLVAALGLLALSVLWPEQEIYGTDTPDARSTPAQNDVAEATEPERLDLPEVDWKSATPAPMPKPVKPMSLPEAKTAAASSTPVSSPMQLKKASVETVLAARALPESAPKRLTPIAMESKRPAIATEALPASAALAAAKAASSNADVQAVIAPLAASGASQAEAVQVLQTFSRHYQSGQLDPFMALFSADARSDRGGRTAIAEDYGRLFSSSHRRSLDLSRLQWQSQNFGWRLNARYVAKVQRESDLLPVKNKGTIELDFVDEGGRLRIRRIALK